MWAQGAYSERAFQLMAGRSAFEVRVHGHYSEIINHKMIPDYPDVQVWVIERVAFIADEAH